ncbi:MAG: glucohydrolase [Burkholderiales bacterium RIFCSPHIGHO2_12_FULL_69_20]|nr:MAG: glucohydrolase [Burkholderiales bacterium RIFCSPHIGHO2_12_FULL_69_20]
MSSLASRWWHDQVVYQIYPRSFADSNGDGIGDLPGITAKLDHLQALGVGIVWLSPVYRSPMADNGYDISDYRDIAPEFGTLADFDALVAALHARGMRLMMDLVVNHCSDRHAWFQQGRQSRDHPWHDHFIWGEPAADGGPPNNPPNNWEACFNGPAWSFNPPTGEYFLHLFSPQQPDLNWRSAALRAEVQDILRFWLARGVDGFRMDVINLIAKPWLADGTLPDAPVVQPGAVQPAFVMVVHGPQLMDHLREMRREVLAQHDLITVGETPLCTPAQAREITDPSTGALDMVFSFEHMDLDSQPGGGKWALKPLHLPDLKAVMQRWQDELGGAHGQGRGWNSLYLGNHDQPRIVSRWGDDGRWRVQSATAWASWLHGQQGTPYIYQGEELGMTNAPLASIDDCRDLESINHHRAAVLAGQNPAEVMRAIRAKGRDNARTPMQWDDSANAGFSTGTPWLPVQTNHREVNAAAARQDPGSVFHHYRQLIALRRQHAVWVFGRTVPLLAAHPHLAAYLRVWHDQRLLVLCNLSGEVQAVDLPAEAWPRQARLQLGNWADVDVAATSAPRSLRPWEARIYLGVGPLDAAPPAHSR